MILQLADIAEQWIGTPFVWRGAVPGAGLDCAQLVICALREAGLECGDVEYGKRDTMADRTIEVLDSLPGIRRTPYKGRHRILVTVCRNCRRKSRHVGVMASDRLLVHALPSHGVIVTEFDPLGVAAVFEAGTDFDLGQRQPGRR
jgi:cell wall-associated NlpC family hydrolase